MVIIRTRVQRPSEPGPFLFHFIIFPTSEIIKTTYLILSFSLSVSFLFLFFLYICLSLSPIFFLSFSLFLKLWFNNFMSRFKSGKKQNFFLHFSHFFRSIQFLLCVRLINYIRGLKVLNGPFDLSFTFCTSN